MSEWNQEDENIKTRMLSIVDDRTMDWMQKKSVSFIRLMAYYKCAMMEIETKFNVLNEEYSLEFDRNPINSIKTRLKNPRSIKEKLEHENKHRAEHETEDAAVKAVTDTVEVEIPSGMIETEIDNMVRDIETRLSYQGMKLEQYLQIIGKTMKDFRKENEEQAKTAVKTRLTLEAIIKAENIEASEEDVDKKIKEMAEIYGKKEEELKTNEQFVTYVKDSLKNEAVVKFIINNAKIK